MGTNAFPVDRTFLMDGHPMEQRIIVSKARPAQLADALSYEDLAAITDIRNRVVANLVRAQEEADALEATVASMDAYANVPVVVGKLVLYGWMNDYDMETYVKGREDFTVPLSWLHNADREVLESIASGDEEKAKVIIAEVMPDVAENNHFSFDVSNEVAAWLEAVSEPASA